MIPPVSAIGPPVGASYLVAALDPTLTNERRLQGTANQVVLTDGGAGADMVLSLPQSIHTGATPQFTRIGIGAAADASIPFIATKAAAIAGQDTEIFRVSTTGTLGNPFFTIGNGTGATTGAVIIWDDANDWLRMGPHGSAANGILFKASTFAHAIAAPLDTYHFAATGNFHLARNTILGTTGSAVAIAIGSSGGAQIGLLQVGSDDEIVFYTHRSGVRHAESVRINRDGQLNISVAAQGLAVAGTKVIGAQGAAIANATDAASAITQLNLLLAAARTHGLIAP